MDVMLTGEPISAERAYQLGLVSRLAEPGQSFEAAMKLANSICENAPLAVRATRGLVAASDDQTEAQAQKAAGEALVGLMATEGNVLARRCAPLLTLSPTRRFQGGPQGVYREARAQVDGQESQALICVTRFILYLRRVELVHRFVLGALQALAG